MIKLSALGDFVLSIGSMQAIRAHHPDARITLLTTAPFVRLAEASGLFDEIWVDRRAPLWRPDLWLALARRLRGARFDRVYDLQRAQRTGWYFRLAGRPEWVGNAVGCSHYYAAPPDRVVHYTQWETAQLATAGIGPITPPDLSFIESDVGRFGLPEHYALVVPGSAPRHPAKRWPADHFAALARALAEAGTTPLLIGGPAEKDALDEIIRACPEARDLGGRTDLFDIVTLARGAAVAVGNDTGPTHLIAAAGCPIVVLFSRESHPIKSRPPWPNVRVLREDSLAELPVAAVRAAVAEIERPA